jgi:hypothetical protein
LSDPLHAFAESRQRVADQLDRLAADLSGVPAEATCDRLRALSTRTRDGRFTVVLLGSFSSGKSSLVNALLGQPALPVKVNPCTAVLTEVVWGPTAEVQVHWRDGRPPERVSTEALLRSFQLESTFDDAGEERDGRFGEIERLVLHHPSPLLRDGVTLIDTPGLDDDDRRTARTLGVLPHADAVLIVLNATRFLTPLERHALEHHVGPLGLHNLFFPVTMADLLTALSDDPDRDKARLHEQSRALLGPLCRVHGQDRLDDRVTLLDTRAGLAAHWDNTTRSRRDPPDAARRQSSGLARFEASLHHFLVHERGRAQLQQVLDTVRAEHAGLYRRAAMDAATASTTVQTLRARQAELEPRFAELNVVAERVARLVEDFIGRQQALVWADLRDFLDQTEDALPDGLADAELGAIPSLRMLGPGGRERLAAHLRDHLDGWLNRRLDTWTLTLRGRLVRSLTGLREELQAEIDDFDHLVAQITTAFTGAELPRPDRLPDEPAPSSQERWLSLALGAALLSPGTMAAGWTDGFDAVTLGAAGRLGARIGVITLGTLLGPVGHAGLLLYAAADTALLVLTGDRQVDRLRTALGDQLAQHLAAHREPLRQQVEADVTRALAPLRTEVSEVARDRARDLRELVEHTIADRERTEADASARAAAWQQALARLDEAATAIGAELP